MYPLWLFATNDIGAIARIRSAQLAASGQRRIEVFVFISSRAVFGFCGSIFATLSYASSACCHLPCRRSIAAINRRVSALLGDRRAAILNCSRARRSEEHTSELQSLRH